MVPEVKPEEIKIKPVPRVVIPLPRAIHEQPKPVNLELKLVNSEPKSEKPESNQESKPIVEKLLKPTTEGKLPKKPELTILNKAKKMLETLNSPGKAKITTLTKAANINTKNEYLSGLITPVEKDDNQDQDMALPE